MKENKIILKSKNGRKTEFNILLSLESDKYKYFVYTNNKKSKENELNVFFSKCKLNNNLLVEVTKKEEYNLKKIMDKFDYGEASEGSN